MNKNSWFRKKGAGEQQKTTSIWYTETVDSNVLIKKSIRKIMREADDHDRLKILRGQGLIKTLQMSYKEGFKMHPLTTSLT